MYGQRSSWSSLWYLGFCWMVMMMLMMGGSSAGTVFLNGPQLEASDLRQIDSYVSSALPIYPKGFQLYGTGSRPIIVKMADPDGTKKQQPNPGYYTNLPAVIPQGFEGIATSSFYLGNPLIFNQNQHQNQQIQQQQQQQFQQVRRAGPADFNVAAPINNQVQGTFQVAQPSIRVENSVEIESEGNNNNQNVMQFMMLTQGQGLPQGRSVDGGIRSNLVEPHQHHQQQQQQRLITNPVLVETARFESSLPIELRNPFYSNENTAASLAHESLPAPGEEVIENWNTRKIQEGKIRDLLTGAGLI